MQTFAQKDQQEQQTADSTNSVEQVESAPEHKNLMRSILGRGQKLNSFGAPPPIIQPKLMVNSPDDKYEQEADKVAEQVMNSDATIDEENDLNIQRKPFLNSPRDVSHIDSSFENSLHQSKGSGTPISNDIRDYIEPRMKSDFSDVRIHTDSKSSEMTERVGARAFTHGNDIYFGSGQYNPNSFDGKRLLAHELTHVVQQTGSKKNNSSNNSIQRKNNSNSEVIQLTPLTNAQRGAHKDNIIAEMSNVHTDFDLGAVVANQQITAAATANANIAKAFFSVGMALIVPGAGGLVVGAATRLGVTIGATTASTLASAIVDGAKSAGNSAIDNSYTQRPIGFFSRITAGFEAAQRAKREWIVANVQNRTVLPDSVLTDLAQYWRNLAAGAESADWATWFRDQWSRYNRQVLAIGPATRTPVVHPPPEHIREHQIGLVWAEHSNGNKYLVQISATTRETGGRRGRTRIAFRTFIEVGYRDLAIERARRSQPRGIQELPWNGIIGIPSSAPAGTAHR